MIQYAENRIKELRWKIRGKYVMITRSAASSTQQISHLHAKVPKISYPDLV